MAKALRIAYLLILGMLLFAVGVVIGNSLLSPTAKVDRQKATVSRVIDGDTIEVEFLVGGRQKVRYIGIDTPETVDLPAGRQGPREPVQCFGREAAAKNKELVEGREVELEKDVSETDKFGRLLRYVFVQDVFVNEFMVKEGYAYAATFPPDVKYQEQFIEAQREAQEQDRGLWSACP